MNKTKNLKQLAQDALNVQDACNLSGVAQGFARAMLDLRALPECTGTDWANRHPVAILWSDKIASLTGSHSSVTCARAYSDAMRMAGEPEKEEHPRSDWGIDTE